MRSVNLKMLLLGLALAATTPLFACPCGDEDLIPSTIKFPGFAHANQLRGDHLICFNDSRRAVVVDLKRGKSFDIGAADDRRFHDGDVADGHALMIAKDRLQAISLDTGKTVHDIAIGTETVYGFGFAGKGKAFVQRGKTLAILDLATGKTLHTITLGETDDIRRGWTPWQRIGNKLYIVGPATTLCVIDLDAGKLSDRFSVDARNGIAALHIQGSVAFCIGSSAPEFTWSRQLDHLTCLDMERKKSHHIGLEKTFRRDSRFSSGPFGTVYLTHQNRIDRFTLSGDRCGTFTTPKGEVVLGVWHDRALVAAKGEIRLLEIKETPVAQK